MRIKLGNKTKRVALYTFILIVVSIFLYYWGTKIRAEEIVVFIRKVGIWAPLVFIILMMITYIIAPLSGTPFFFAGFFLFGALVQIYNYFAFLGAVTINFWIARKWGRGLVIRLAGRGNMEKIDEFSRDYGIKSLIFLRFLQGQFHDFISYAYGLTNIKFLHYFLVSALAPIPVIFLWQSYIFERIENLRQFTVIYLISLIPVFIISAIFAAKIRGKKKT